MSKLPSITRKGKKNPGDQVDLSWGEDEAFFPAEMIADFSRKHAGDVLTALLQHVANNAKAACWVTAKIFGEGGWAADAAAIMGTTTSADAYARARGRAMDSFVSGKIDAPALGMILNVLADRQAELETVPAPVLKMKDAL